MVAGGWCCQDSGGPVVPESMLSTPVLKPPQVHPGLGPISLSPLGQRAPLSHDFLLSCSCAISSGAGIEVWETRVLAQGRWPLS